VTTQSDREPPGARRRVRPITWAILGGIAAAAAVVVLIALSVRTSFQHACEVCMTFRGNTACREALGRTAAEATRTATDNACAVLGATGMTLSIECSNTAPDSVACR
jgi:hypothetical protein